MKNAQLWKRILNEGFLATGQPVHVSVLQQQIIKAPLIVDSRFGEIADNGLTAHCNTLAFPFPQFWLEGDCESPDKPESKGSRWGCFVESKDVPTTIYQTYTIACFASVTNKPVAMCGSLRGIRPDTTTTGYSLELLSRYNNDSKIDLILRECVLYLFDVLELLACKNVSLQTNLIDSKTSNRAAKRHGGTPDSYRYHTLVVRPPGAKSDTPSQDIGIMPRHVCRGHFSEYGPEFGKGLLFGRYAGRFYIPPHLKGDKKNGVVEKDYEVR